jgi:hypothetical protein
MGSGAVSVRQSSSVNDNPSLSAEDVAAYIDGRLSGEDLERVETFLAANPAARAELVEASRLVATVPQGKPQSKRAWVVGSTLVAAAAALLIVVPLVNRQSQSPPVQTERRSATDETARLRAIAPADGAPLSVSDARFIWNSVPGAQYRFTLTDANGSVVWETSTTDTVALLPKEKTLNASNSYYWNVDALAEDGSSVTTGVRELKVVVK